MQPMVQKFAVLIVTFVTSTSIFVPCPGNFCALPSAQKFDGLLEEFLPTAERISSDGSTKWARKTPLTAMPAGGVF